MPDERKVGTGHFRVVVGNSRERGERTRVDSNNVVVDRRGLGSLSSFPRWQLT